MYGEIQIDGSRLLKPGKNLLVVKVTGRVDGNSSEASSAAIDFSILPYVKVSRKVEK